MQRVSPCPSPSSTTSNSSPAQTTDRITRSGLFVPITAITTYGNGISTGVPFSYVCSEVIEQLNVTSSGAITTS
jgi:hypothetical protein